MKKRMAVAAVAVGLASLGWGAENKVTNYWPGFVGIQATCTNTGVTGLSTGVVYACWPISVLPQATAASVVTTNGSWKQLTYAWLDGLWASQNRISATNRSARVALARQIVTGSTGDFSTVYSVRVDLSATGAVSVVGE